MLAATNTKQLKRLGCVLITISALHSTLNNNTLVYQLAATLCCSYRYPCRSKAEMALSIKPHTRNLERQWTTPVFYRISRWRTKTGSSNNFASFSDNNAIPSPKTQLHTKTAIFDLVQQWATYCLPLKSTWQKNRKYLQLRYCKR